MTQPARLTLEQTPKLRARIEAEAFTRGMSINHFCNMVLGDFLSECEAREGVGHQTCCFCRDVAEGVGRCCWCSRWRG